MGIDVADAAAEQWDAVDQIEYILMLRHNGPRQALQIVQRRIARLEITKRQLANHKRMTENLLRGEQRAKSLVGDAQMINPNRGINEDHPRLVRRRGIGLSSGIVPPRRASRLAASRSINRLSASRINAAVSLIPL